MTPTTGRPPTYGGRLQDLPAILEAQARLAVGRHAWVALPRGLVLGLKVGCGNRREWRLCRAGAPVSDLELKTCRRHLGLPAEAWALGETTHDDFPRCFTLTEI